MKQIAKLKRYLVGSVLAYQVRVALDRFVTFSVFLGVTMEDLANLPS